MRRLSSAFLVTALGFLAACDGGTTDPVASPLVFEGELAAQGSESHTFTVLSGGLLQIDVPRLQEKVGEGEEPLGLFVTVGLGVGRPLEGQCSTRYSVRANEGDRLVFSLSGAEFCISIFDIGVLLTDQVIEYTVSVSSQ